MLTFAKSHPKYQFMCGRFALNALPEEAMRLFLLDDIEDFPPRFNIAPTQPILTIEATEAIGHNRAKRKAVLARWGLIPSWVKDVAAFPLLTLARAESVAEKASFRGPLRHHRILVPATGYYEWKKGEGKKSQPYLIRPRQGGIIAMAGLKETYLSPDGSELDTMALITTASNSNIAAVHDRMPVIIKEQDFDRWLNCRDYDPKQISDLLFPQAEGLEAVAITDKVNKVSNMGPDVQTPANLNDPVENSPTNTTNISGASDQLKLF
jgi:putative SOS response-associated peptidase YedK